MIADYPLRFTPIFRRALWGGRRLETVLGKSLPPGNDYAESWEIVDHGADQSCVTHGPLQGMALGALVRERGADLLGRHHPQDHFPLLFKFLDVRQNLSVQVHPNDEQAAPTGPARSRQDGGLVRAPRRTGQSNLTRGSATGSIARRWSWPSHAGRPRAACMSSSQRRGTACSSPPGPCTRWEPDCWWPKSSSRATRRFGCSTGIVSDPTDCRGHCMSGRPWRSLTFGAAPVQPVGTETDRLSHVND